MRTIVSAVVTATILLGFTDLWAAQQIQQIPRRPEIPVRPAPAVSEDCVGFNPATATVVQSGNSWRIVDGNHSMFDFGPNKNHADYSLSVIKTYGMTQSCFVGRPQPSLQYMLVSGRAPSGSMANEDCLSFNPAGINVAHIQNDWKIVEGNHWVFSFGNKEAEARQAFAHIKRHNFNASCYVGRPNARFTYLKVAGPLLAQAPQLPQRPVVPTLPNVHPPLAGQVPGPSAAAPGTAPTPAGPSTPSNLRPVSPSLPHGVGPQLERPPLLRPTVGGPDLKVDRVWLAQYVPPAQMTGYTPLSGNPAPGQQVYLVCEFENAGTDLKGEWNVAYLVDGQQVYGQRFGDLPAKTKRNPAAPYVVQGAGSHRYECVLDPENRIPEVGASGNNRGSATFQVAAAGTPPPGPGIPTHAGPPQPPASPAQGSVPPSSTAPNYGSPVTGSPSSTTPNYGTPVTTSPPTSGTPGVHQATPAPSPLPDLRVQKAWVAQWNADKTQYLPLPTPMPGQEVLLVCEFDNTGAPVSSQVRVGWYIDGQMIGDMGVPSLATGQKRNPARSYRFSSPGIHRYECVLDAEGRANESSEGNNRQLIVVQVGPGMPSPQPGQTSSPVAPASLANPGQASTPPGPPGLGTPPNQLICPAGYNRVLIPAPPFVDCISDPWKEVDQVSPGCPPVPWPAQGSYVNDKSGHEDKCVAKGPLPPEIEGPTLCPPPVPGGKVEKKVQPGTDVCRIFVPNPPQRTNPIVQQ